MYRDVLKVYDEDCIIYNTSLDGTRYDIGLENYTSSIERKMAFEFNWQVWGCLMGVWFIIFLLVSRGVHSMRYILYISLPLSLVFIFCLLMFSIQLEGGAAGVREYLFGKPECLATGF